MHGPNYKRLKKMEKAQLKNGHHDWRMEEPDSKGISWLTVGHNASHEFELGVDADDRVWQRASGPGVREGAPPEPVAPEDEAADVEWQAYYERYNAWEAENYTYVTSEPELVPNGDVGYCGHY